MVSELRDHLLRHLQGVEKKKIEQMVLDYISKLVGFSCSSNFNRTLSSMYNSQGVVSEPIGGGCVICMCGVCTCMCACPGEVPMDVCRREVDCNVFLAHFLC
jgi:hypothetical protein